MNHPVASPAASLLIVDDSVANLQLLAGMLKQRGYRVRPVLNGELALQAARSDPPDLILLDITMPDMDGYQVCERLKADALLGSIPVIFISALDGVIDKVKAFAVGGVDFVTKPFQFAEVEARVRTHLTLRQRDQQLERAISELKEVERLRDNLVHMIVHDMRTPITAVRLSLEILAEDGWQTEATRTRMLALAHRSTDTLNEMVAQLLDVSRLEAGEMPIHKEHLDLASTLASTLESLGSLAAEKCISLHAPTPVLAWFDKDLIVRVVGNLLTNAFKFTPDKGEILVTLSCDGDFARIEVVDNGKGIPAAYHQMIFEKFGQAEDLHKRIGTGLGLAFCRLVVEAHGGKIGVESEVGRGSTFWFTLSLQGDSSNGKEVHSQGT